MLELATMTSHRNLVLQVNHFYYEYVHCVWQPCTYIKHLYNYTTSQILDLATLDRILILGAQTLRVATIYNQ